MGWQPVIEYVELEPAAPAPVKKQVWDGEKFVSMTLHRHQGVPNGEKLRWLQETYGQPGTYVNGRFWDYSRAGDFTIMDEKVYMWYQMKWKKK